MKISHTQPLKKVEFEVLDDFIVDFLKELHALHQPGDWIIKYVSPSKFGSLFLFLEVTQEVYDFLWNLAMEYGYAIHED